MKILHVTDTHLVPAGETLYSIDPAERLAAVMDHARAHHADADLMVITGDLTDRGDAPSYAQLKRLLGDLPFPVRLLLGNHDDRDTFCAAFPDEPRDGSGFVQSVMQVPGSDDRLVFLDTNETGISGGRFCAARREWLRETLADHAESPLTVFLHHPPVDHMMTHFDNIGLTDRAELMEILRGHPGGVRHMFFGHIHIPLSGTLAGGIGYTAGRGPAHQFRQEFGNPAPDWIVGKPNYAVILITPESVSCHGIDTIEAELAATTTPCAGP
ncbi:phosphodiesterase [Sulfitobacter sp. LCG007]